MMDVSLPLSCDYLHLRDSKTSMRKKMKEL